MAGPDRLGRMLIATIANPAVDPIVMPGQAILNTRRPVEELDEDFAALDLERIGVVAELREAVADVMAARLRHAEEDEARPSATRDSLRTGTRPVATSTEVLTAERELEVDALWDQVATVAERLIDCAAVSRAWLAEWLRLEGARQVSERDEPVPSEVRVDTSRERLRLLGDPFVSVDTARLRSWVAGQREVALVGGEAA